MNSQFVDQQTAPRLIAIRAQLAAMNGELCQSIRAEIQQGTPPFLFSQWLESDLNPTAGLSFDYRDEIVSAVLPLEQPDPPPAHPPGEMVFYQPTPARHIFDLFRQTSLVETDVLIDLGSGLGHVPLLASLCTGARSIGIEREAAYVACASHCAEGLHLERAAFLEEDAREADLSTGTVFYLYTPFTGAILATVLRRLHDESAKRPIRVGTFGPCTETVACERWLHAAMPPRPDRITVFQSNG